jgi:hypothetical protein
MADTSLDPNTQTVQLIDKEKQEQEEHKGQGSDWTGWTDWGIKSSWLSAVCFLSTGLARSKFVKCACALDMGARD